MGVSGSLNGGWAAGSVSADPQPWYKWADVEPLSQARKGKEEMHPWMHVGEGRGRRDQRVAVCWSTLVTITNTTDWGREGRGGGVKQQTLIASEY